MPAFFCLYDRDGNHMFSYIPTYTVYLISLQYAIEKDFPQKIFFGCKNSAY